MMKIKSTLLLFFFFSLAVQAQYLTKVDSMILTNASIWGVCNDEGDSLLITTIRTPASKPHIYMRKANYSNIAGQSSLVQLTTDADFTSISNMTDHKSIVFNNEIYVAFSTQGDTDLFLFKTDINGTRIGSIVTVPTGGEPTNDMMLVTDGTYIYVLHFDPPTPEQSHVFTYDTNLNQVGSEFSTTTNAHNGIGHTVYYDGRFWLFSGSKFGFNANLILTKWIGTSWSPISSTTLITAPTGEGYWFTTGAVFDPTNLRWYVTTNHIYSGQSITQEHIDLLVFDTNFTLLDQDHITSTGYFRPHLAIYGSNLYLTYDNSGGGSVFLLKYAIGTGTVLSAYSSQPSSTISTGTSNVPLAGFTITPDGSANFTAVTVTGTVNTTSDLSNVRIYRDYNGDGIINTSGGTDASVSGSGISFSTSMGFTISGETGFSSARNYLIVADIGSSATSPTVAVSISTGNFTTSGSINSGSMSAVTRNINSIGDYRSSASGSYGSAGSWESWNGSSWVAAGTAPTSTTNIFIKSGYTITVEATDCNCRNLTVEGGGTLYSNQSAAIRFINVYGNITCDGTIGNGSTFDGIAFEIQGGTTCTISGSGTFNAARIRTEGAGTVNLTISMSITLRFNGTALYNNVDNSLFNMTLSSGSTLSLSGDGGAGSGGALSIDGTDGANAGERGGTFTINGTLTISGGASSNPMLYAKTNNTSTACAITIGSSGIVNTGAADFGASGTGGHTFTMSSGAKLTFTGEPASFVNPDGTNNTFSFGSTSTISYTKSGTQTVHAFGSNVSVGNITLSGSGNKNITAERILKFSGTLTTGGLLVLQSGATSTAAIAELTSGTITGAVTVERYVNSGTRRWRFIGFPFSSGVTLQSYRDDIWLSGAGTGSGSLASTNYNSNGFHYTTGNNTSVYYYNDAKNAGSADTRWEGVATITHELTAGKGYRVFYRGPVSQGTTCIDGTSPTPNAGTLSASGTLKTGTNTFSVSCSNGCVNVPASNNDDGWNMVANPYPSAIDWNATSGWTKTNISGTIWIWNPTTNTYGNWDGTTATNSVTRYIASGQAFFVRATSSSPVLSCTEAVKTKNSGSNMFKAGEANLLRVTLFFDSLNNDECVVRFMAGKKDTYDPGEDVNKLPNPELNIYSIPAAGKNVSVNYLDEFDGSSRYNIPLGVSAPAAEYKLVFSEVSSFGGSPILLIDHFLNNTILLHDNYAYPFSVTADPASFGEKRFELVFNSTTTNLTEQATSTQFHLYPNPVKDELHISYSNISSSTCHIRIFDLGGKELLEVKKDIDKSTGELRLQTDMLKEGFYELLVSDESGRLLKTMRFVK